MPQHPDLAKLKEALHAAERREAAEREKRLKALKDLQAAELAAQRRREREIGALAWKAGLAGYSNATLETLFRRLASGHHPAPLVPVVVADPEDVME